MHAHDPREARVALKDDRSTAREGIIHSEARAAS
jgi:hypothetical protein